MSGCLYKTFPGNSYTFFPDIVAMMKLRSFSILIVSIFPLMNKGSRIFFTKKKNEKHIVSFLSRKNFMNKRNGKRALHV